MIYLGDYPAGATVRFMWNTNDQTGASITRSTDGTLKIYRDGSADERTSLNGVTQTEDFDAATGVHSVAIDLWDNTDVGFYEAGHEYSVVMTGMVIDTKTVNACIAMFSIERHAATRLSVDASGNAKAQLANGVTHGGNAAVFQWLQAVGYHPTDYTVYISSGGDAVSPVLLVAGGVNAKGIEVNANGAGGQAVLLNGVSVGTALSSIATILGQLSGMTSVAAWLRGLFRKDAMNATAKSEVNSGGGGFDEATDSGEGARDTAPAATTALVLATPANKLATDANGKVTYANAAPPTAAAIATEVWSTTVRTLSSYGTLATDVAAAVWNAGTRTLTGFATLVTDLLAALEAAHGAGSWKEGTSSGAGAFTVTVTVTDATDPLENVTVRYTSGVDSYTAVTNADGEAVFNLDAATYVVAATRAGYTYAGGTHEVAGDDEKAIEMTAVVISPPADPAQTTAYGVTRRADGIAEPNVRVLVKLVTPTTEGQHSRRELWVRSGPDGAYQIELLKSAAYWMRRDKGPGVWTKFETTDADTFELPII